MQLLLLSLFYLKIKKMTNGNGTLAILISQLACCVENPEKEARLMMMHLCKQDPRLPSFTGLTEVEHEQLTDMVNRRLSGEPLQYILKEWEFMGIPLQVGKGVLCPRPDSECIAEKAISLLRDVKSPIVIDLCSGSGALALAINEFVRDSQIIAVEKYPEAFSYLEQNIKERNITAVLEDVTEYYKAVEDNSISLIISNPPYIPWEEQPLLANELSYEPPTALFEPSYLYFYELIINLYADKLVAGGAIVFEIPTFKEDDVVNLFSKKKFFTELVIDYNKTVRGVVGIKL